MPLRLHINPAYFLGLTNGAHTAAAFAGGASEADVATRMANSIGRSNKLSTHNPVDLASARRADAIRRIERFAHGDET